MIGTQKNMPCEQGMFLVDRIREARKAGNSTEPRAFAAQTSASAVLLVSAYVYALPVSSTHIMTTSIMGVGASRRLSAVRWSVAQRVAMAWILTIPGAAISAWVAYLVVNAVV